MNMVDVTVKGIRLHCENDIGEYYDFFIPYSLYRMSKTDAYEHIPEGHKLIDMKRDYQQYKVKYEDLKKISL